MIKVLFSLLSPELDAVSEETISVGVGADARGTELHVEIASAR